jgi:hypothetical protein
LENKFTIGHKINTGGYSGEMTRANMTRVAYDHREGGKEMRWWSSGHGARPEVEPEQARLKEGLTGHRVM